VLGYVWAVYKNNINPVAGVGIATLCCMGLIVGAVLGILRKDGNEGRKHEQS
jgi:hypothetical protein